MGNTSTHKAKQMFCLAYCGNRESIGEQSCDHCEMNPAFESHFVLSENAKILIAEGILADGMELTDRLFVGKTEELKNQLTVTGVR